jgi:hypothetical protein
MAVSVSVIAAASRPAAVAGRTGASVVAVVAVVAEVAVVTVVAVVEGLVGVAGGPAVDRPPPAHAASSTLAAMRPTSRDTTTILAAPITAGSLVAGSPHSVHDQRVREQLAGAPGAPGDRRRPRRRRVVRDESMASWVAGARSAYLRRCA